MVEVLKGTPTGSALAPRLLEADLAAPELLDIEVASALRKYYLRGDVSLDDASLAVAVLREWDITRVPHLDIVLDTVRWWENASAYDSAYLAVATLVGGVVVTVDGPLSRAPVTAVVVENVRVGPPG